MHGLPNGLARSRALKMGPAEERDAVPARLRFIQLRATHLFLALLLIDRDSTVEQDNDLLLLL